MIGAWVARRGPGAGLKSVGLIKGLWMMDVGPGGSRSAMGPDATVHKAAALRGEVRNPAGRALYSCFCRASFVCNQRQKKMLCEQLYVYFLSVINVSMSRQQSIHFVNRLVLTTSKDCFRV